MLPEYPKFKSLESEDVNQIKQHLKQAAPKICEWALANLFIWKDFDHTLLTIIHKNLCIYISPPNEPPYFLEPFGIHKIPETTEICLKHAGKISRASENFVSGLNLYKYRIICLRNQFDYIYQTKALAELQGRKFDGKRNHIKKFNNRFPNHEFIHLDASHKNDALKLFDTWFDKKRETSYFVKLPHPFQKSAINKAFSYFEPLNMMGGAILIEKEMKGFILGSALNSETVAIHFQYGDPSIYGISQILLWEACHKIFSSFRHINLEQDLGIPGLRKAKLSYHPLRLEKKFEIKSIP